MVKIKPEQLRLIMKIHKMNVKQLAEALDINRQSIWYALNGNPVGGKLIGQLLKFSGWDFEDIFFVDNISLKTKKLVGEKHD